jgi:Fic family protein/DNA-binding Xre family transcriptional regulator
MDYRTKLQRIVVASGLSQQSLAEKLGTSFVTLNNWLNGKATPTRKDLLEKIDSLFVEYLGVTDVDVAALRELKHSAKKQRLTARVLIKNKEMLDKITLNLTYHTNTIEGSTMTKSDVAAVLFEHQTLKNRTQIEQREAINHRVALDFLLDELAADSRLQFTPELIKKVHLLLMNGILSNAGEWRNHGVRIQGSRVALANFMRISEKIQHLCNDLNSETKDPIAVLARTHAVFEQIHPFSDGNGRTGRLVMFIKSLQFGIVPPIVPKERKAVYYRYLELAQMDEKYDNLEQFIAESIIATAELLEG